MRRILQTIAQRSTSSTFKRSFGLILVAEAITIAAAWYLLDSNITGWLREKAALTVRISQKLATSEDWRLIDTIPKDRTSPLFQKYEREITELSPRFFPQIQGDVFVEVVNRGDTYVVAPADPHPMDDTGKATKWELAAYATGKTTYNDVPYSDYNGTVLSALTPIFRNGKVVGLAGAEYDTATLTDLQGLVKRAFWLSILPAILLSLVVAYGLANMFVDPMEIFRRIDETASSRSRGAAPADPLSRLSPREREIAELVRRGLKNKEIAEKLFVTPETVKQHLKNIKDKTGFTRVDLAVHAEATRLSSDREAATPA
jgi:RNA polymerase sigma factor (sigma-70 family)